jgi:hypothetical protein
VILQLSPPPQKLWESWKRHRRFQSGQSPRLFHSSSRGQTLRASDSSNCCVAVVRCSPGARTRSSAWRQTGSETNLLVSTLRAADRGSSRRAHSHAVSTAPISRSAGRCFRVIHPFHPWLGREFELVVHRRTWGEDRVFFCDERGRLVALPASWTDFLSPDPFVKGCRLTLESGESDKRLDGIVSSAQ